MGLQRKELGMMDASIAVKAMRTNLTGIQMKAQGKERTYHARIKGR